MIESTFILDVDREEEYYLAIILDLIGDVTSSKSGDGTLTVTVDCQNDEESSIMKDILRHLEYVKNVKEQTSELK